MLELEISKRYRRAKCADSQLISLENGDLTGALEGFVNTMGGSRIGENGVREEEFLEIERTPEGYVAHVLEEHKDDDGIVKKVYTEQNLDMRDLGDAVKALDVGDSVRVHLTAKDIKELKDKRTPYVHGHEEVRASVSSTPQLYDILESAIGFYSTEVEVANQYGIHARPASMLAKESAHYDCNVTATYDGNTIDAKGIMGWMTFGASQGSRIFLKSENNGGELDAEACIRSLSGIFKNKFGEE